MAVHVRCRGCEHRLFDVEEAWEHEPTFGGRVRVNRAHVERRCPSCSLTSVGVITAERGLPVAGELAGAWRCRCDRHSAEVDAHKGRLRVGCPKCHVAVRVVAEDALLAVHAPAHATDDVSEEVERVS